jgi:hypothetical protein
VVALVLLEWSAGLLAAASWTQSWSIVRRGHFRVVAWTGVLLALLAGLALGASGEAGLPTAGFVAVTGIYLVSQYVGAEPAGVVAGFAGGALGVVALAFLAVLIPSWQWLPAMAGLVSGALLLGAVTNGMLLGHWYLNQPGLKTWALSRLTTLSLVAVAASAIAGVAGGRLLARAATEGAAFAWPGSGSLSIAFFVIWLSLVAFTGAVVWMAKRCVEIRSIQSATGLYYVAILTAGVSEFLVRYLMLSA